MSAQRPIVELSPLGDGEIERIRRLRARVHAEAAAVIPFFKALHAAGLVQGWRAIQSVNEDPDRRNAYSGPLYTGRELIRKKT